MRPASAAGAVLAGMLLAQAPVHAQWQDFAWVPMPGVADKAAILLPVGLDGLECRMQLDTGAAASILYRQNLPARFQPEPGGTRVRVADVRIGGQRSARSFELMYEPRPGGQPAGCEAPAGTVGADILAGARLVLDLPRARFQILPGPAPAPGAPGAHVLDMAPFAFAGRPAVNPMVGATLDDGRRVDLLVDTGSAVMALNVFRERDWLRLVGLERLPAAATFHAPRWGGQAACYSAPTGKPVALGSMTLEAGTVATHCVDPRGVPDDGRLYGLVGLAPFLDRQVTLDYAAGKFIVEPPADP